VGVLVKGPFELARSGWTHVVLITIQLDRGEAASIARAFGLLSS